MALSPMDIIHKEFSHGMRGYDVGEVDEFLEEVKDEISSLQNQLLEKGKELSACEQKLAHYTEIESTLNSAFISAQQSADSIKEQARAEGERIYREAETKAQEIVRAALAEKQTTIAEYDRLKTSEDEFRRSYKALLQHFVNEANMIPVHDDSDDEPVVGQNPGEPSVSVAVEEIIEDATPVKEENTVKAEAPNPGPAVQIIEEEDIELIEASAPADATSSEATPAEEVAAVRGYEAYGEVEEDLDIDEND